MGTLLHMMFKIIFILTLILGSAFSQRSQRDFERELKAQNSAIQSLKDEIEATKKRISSENKKEKSSVRKMSNLSEEISLLQKLLKELGREEKLLVADISRMERKIGESEDEDDPEGSKEIGGRRRQKSRTRRRTWPRSRGGEKAGGDESKPRVNHFSKEGKNDRPAIPWPFPQTTEACQNIVF